MHQSAEAPTGLAGEDVSSTVLNDDARRVPETTEEKPFEPFAQRTHGIEQAQDRTPRTDTRRGRSTPFPVSHPLHLTHLGYPTVPAALVRPFVEPPADDDEARDCTRSRDSLAPSQSLSQVALQRRAQGIGPSHVGETSEQGGKPSVRDPRAHETHRGETMALLDWARRVGREHHHHHHHAPYGPASAGIRDGTVLGTPWDGTDVDPASGTSSSEVGVVRDVAAERHWVEGEGSFDDDPRAQEEQRQGTAWRHDPQEQYLHPGASPHQAHPPENASSPFSAGWQSPRISDCVPRDDEVSALERMTIGGTTTVGGMTAAGGVPL